MKRIGIITTALLLTGLWGCQSDQTTMRRHHEEDTTRTESRIVAPGDNAPKEGDRRPGGTSVEEKRSDPKTVVE